MPELARGSMVISYRIRKSKKAKHINIMVKVDVIEVVAPAGIADKKIISLVESKREWIFHTVERLKLLNPRTDTKRDLLSGVNLSFKGQNYSLQIAEHEGRLTRVNLESKGFVVSVNKDLPLQQRQDEVRAKLEQWYKNQAKELIFTLLEQNRPKLGVQYNEVRIKDQKTRWGSCSGLGNLNFNWRLVMAPVHVVEYVVVHELCHLKQMNHSREFWQLVARLIPDYADRRKWLKQHGAELRL